jgi:hypothetical protein
MMSQAPVADQGRPIAPDRAAAIAELERLAQFLDSNWRIPGTSIRFGMDAIVGLLPVVGDAAAGLVSAYIILKAREHGAGNTMIARMIGNMAIDTVVGSVPILGSIFDVYFKANNRNIRLLHRHLNSREPRSQPSQRSRTYLP